MNVKKVGHAGTLDPFATGVLLVCTGKATKKVPELMESEKEYIGTIELGVQTDTDDVTGEVIARGDPSPIRFEKVEEVCRRFEGSVPQIPPMYSAKKVNGRRLYKLARQGKVIERQPKIVTIRALDILDYNPPFITIHVVCSKGTYIRALARDMGNELGCKGNLHSLTRTRVGDYRIEESMTLDDFKELLGNFSEDVFQ